MTKKMETFDTPMGLAGDGGVEPTMTTSEFAHRIGRTSSSVQGKQGKRYHKYITRLDGGKGKGMGKVFVTEANYRRYVLDMELQHNLIAVCGLFTEYLNKELLISYADIATLVSNNSKYTLKTIRQTLHSMVISYQMALAITEAYKKHDNDKIKSFDMYYGWASI